MPTVVEQTQVKKKVKLLQNAKVDFVSLVKHGANRQPFRIVKSDDHLEGGDDKAMMIVQSLLVPKGKVLDELTKEEALTWLSEARTDEVREADGYDKLVQLPVEKFEDGSVHMLGLGDTGVYAIVGKLSSEPTGKELSIGDVELEQLKKFQSVMDTPMEEIEPPKGMVATFGQLLDREIFSMMDVIHGSLRQKAAKPAVRKKTVLGAIDAFSKFMSMAMDELGKEAVKFDGSAFAAMKNKEDEPMAELFKSMDEFTDAVGGIIAKAFEVRDKAKAKGEGDGAAPTDGDGEGTTANKNDDGNDNGAAPVQKTEGDDPMAKVLASVEALTEQVTTIATKQEGFEQQLSGHHVDDDGVDGDGDGVDGEEKSVFSGLLTKS